jgi:hypothetical protein
LALGFLITKSSILLVYLEKEMPVFITDFTNKVWCMENPVDGYLTVGYLGRPGVRVEDILAFVETQEKQFKTFMQKKAERLEKDGKRGKGNPRSDKSRRESNAEEPGSGSGAGTEGGRPS